MTTITIKRDLAGISKPEIHNLSGSINLLDWLCDNMEQDANGLHCQFLLNEKELCNTWDFDPDDCNQKLDINIGEFDSFVVIVRPQGVDPISWLYIAIVAVVAAVATTLLMPKPELPDDDDAGSKNNQLNQASNGYGLRKAIPDISGQVVSFPTFAQRPYFYYENNLRIWEEVFYIGAGYYDFEPPKEGDTSFDIIEDYSYTVSQPNEHPTQLTSVNINPSTQDVDLSADNEQFRLVDLAGRELKADGTIILDETSIKYLGLEIGASVRLYLELIAPFLIIDGNYTVTSVSTDRFIVSPSPTGDDRTIEAGTVTNNDFPPIHPSYVIGEAEHIWVSLKMPQGIRSDGGDALTIRAEIFAEQLDANNVPTGVTFTKEVSFTGKTQTAQYQTFRLDNTDGLTGISKYRVMVKKLNSDLGGSALDLLTLEYIAAVKFYTPNFGNITLLRTTRRSSQRVNQGASEKVNLLVTRRLRIYNHVTGVYGTDYVATRRFCDYVFYLLHERMNVPISEINTDELYGISDSLTDEQLGYFDFTFDDKNVSARERLEITCNAARTRYWNEGLLWSFVREEAKPFKTLTFNRRNLKSASASYVQKFSLPMDKDGVSLKYVDPVKNVEKTIYKRIVNNAILDGESINPIEITLAGCRNLTQAQNRLNLEIRRLLYQRCKVTDTALADAQMIRTGERCDWVDIYDGDIFDGEVLSVSSNQYLTSERFVPAIGVEYWVYITDADGYPSNSVRAYPRTDGNIFGFMADGLAGVFLADNTVQLGSKYVIASNNDLDASAFTLIGRGRPNEKGECSIELGEYTDLMFEDD